MSLSTLQLAGTGALVLLAGSANAPQGSSLVLVSDVPAPSRLDLNLDWKTTQTASDVLTDLLDVDGIRVVADRSRWDLPETLALRHDFASDSLIHLYCTAGIDRAVFLESPVPSPASALSIRRERSGSKLHQRDKTFFTDTTRLERSDEQCSLCDSLTTECLRRQL